MVKLRVALFHKGTGGGYKVIQVGGYNHHPCSISFTFLRCSNEKVPYVLDPLEFEN